MRASRDQGLTSAGLPGRRLYSLAPCSWRNESARRKQGSAATRRRGGLDFERPTPERDRSYHSGGNILNIRLHSGVAERAPHQLHRRKKSAAFLRRAPSSELFPLLQTSQGEKNYRSKGSGSTLSAHVCIQHPHLRLIFRATIRPPV